MTVIFIGFATMTTSKAYSETNLTTVKFDYWSSHSYYACSYVEQKAHFFAEKLGATDITVKCTGGLPWNDWVSADISYAVPMKKSVAEVTKLRVNEACDFNQKLIEKIIPTFNPTEVKRKGVCWDSSGRLRYSVTH